MRKSRPSGPSRLAWSLPAPWRGRLCSVALAADDQAVDHDADAELERQFTLDLAGAREVTLATWERRTWIERALCWAAYQLLRL